MTVHTREYTQSEFAVVPPDARLVWLLPGIATLGVLTGVAVLAMQEPQAWIALPITLVAFIVIALILHRQRIRIGNGTLEVVAGVNSRRIAIDDLDLSTARIADLREHTQFKPTMKLFGTRLPGLSMGHFRLRDRSRAFVLVTDPSRVLVLTERSGRRLLLSLVHPQVLLDALRALSVSHPN